jgi:hypothetical protein
MTHDPGAAKIAELLDAPSTELEAAVDALADALETADPKESEGARLPPGALAPIGRLQSYYRGLHRRIDETESGNGGGRDEAERGLKRMEEGLQTFAAAVRLEGEEAAQEAKRAAAEMDRAGGEIERAIERLR